jgi:hypothetical protein
MLENELLSFEEYYQSCFVAKKASSFRKKSQEFDVFRRQKALQ